MEIHVKGRDFHIRNSKIQVAIQVVDRDFEIRRKKRKKIQVIN